MTKTYLEEKLEVLSNALADMRKELACAEARAAEAEEARPSEHDLETLHKDLLTEQEHSRKLLEYIGGTY